MWPRLAGGGGSGGWTRWATLSGLLLSCSKNHPGVNTNSVRATRSSGNFNDIIIIYYDSINQINQSIYQFHHGEVCSNRVAVGPRAVLVARTDSVPTPAVKHRRAALVGVAQCVTWPARVAMAFRFDETYKKIEKSLFFLWPKTLFVCPKCTLMSPWPHQFIIIIPHFLLISIKSHFSSLSSLPASRPFHAGNFDIASNIKTKCGARTTTKKKEQKKFWGGKKKKSAFEDTQQRSSAVCHIKPLPEPENFDPDRTHCYSQRNWPSAGSVCSQLKLRYSG